jgi:hypothetical protein
MLAQLATVKARLALDPIDPTNDVLLLRAIIAVSARFDQETNRTLARTENAVFEFPADDSEIVVPCYPIEIVSKFELKSSEAEGWVEQSGVEFLVRRGCAISLHSAFWSPHSALCSARVTYTGGYLVPGDPIPQPTASGVQPVALPVDLEQAVVEQTAFWFQTREKLGVIRQWPKGGNYEQFSDLDLLPSVRETLSRHTRFAL